MARTRTGTLVVPGRDGLWKGRITQTHEDGTTSRPLYSLGTPDKALAIRKLSRLVAALDAGQDPMVAASTADRPETVREYAGAWLVRRAVQGIAMAPDERRNVERHVVPAIGHLAPRDVRPFHVRAILEAVAGRTYVRGKTRAVEKRYR